MTPNMRSGLGDRRKPCYEVTQIDMEHLGPNEDFSRGCFVLLYSSMDHMETIKALARACDMGFLEVAVRPKESCG